MHKDRFVDDGGRVLTCDTLSKTGLVKHGFSINRNGISGGIYTSLNLGVYTGDDEKNVRHNFTLFCQDLSIDPNDLVLAQQTHTTNVRVVTEADRGKGFYFHSDFSDVDGLITNERGVALASFCADCTPILLLDPIHHAVGSIHSGWRGTLGKIVQRAVLLMKKEYGTCAEDLLVAMGPSLKQCHFAVDTEVYLAFLEKFRTIALKNTVEKDGKYYIDTDALNRYSLLQVGVQESHISCCALCTYCEENMFYSYRRSGETGRMCAVIELV
ncbi:MAG: peptidoglycan editing factor PgeF [Ruminococcaceae bacterium]|nr:peptidoglycan editing factor PgeF [Oscillospiraceae bacterium]